jgi:alpha-L-fucosidase
VDGSFSIDPLQRSLPAWFDDAKLGMFIHWLPASIPAFAPVGEVPIDWTLPESWSESPYSESYSDMMLMPGSSAARYHAEHYGDLPFEAFVDRFRELISLWDPEPWADLAERAGARYVVLVTKSDDGFLLWPSAHPHPRLQARQAQRDVVGELAASVRARGIRFGVYYSGWDSTFSQGPLPITSLEELAAAYPRSEEYAAYAEAHWRELVERYHPSVLWCDFGYPENAETSTDDFFRWYFQQVPDGVVNDRFDDNEGTDDRRSYRDYRTYEYKRDFSNAVQDIKWEATRGIGYSFAYNRQETDATYLSATELLRQFVDIVARGGNLLLNMGPTGAGRVPWAQAQRFQAFGWWLRRYGSAIYGTRRWDRPTGATGDGLDVRFTASDDAVHAIVLGTPPESAVELDVRPAAGAQIRIEGTHTMLSWETTNHGVRVQLPEPPDEQPAIAFVLTPRAAVSP